MAVDPQLLEIMKVTAWQQAVIGRRAAWEVREALRIDDSPPPPVPRARPVGSGTYALRRAAKVEPPLNPRALVEHPAFNRRVHGVWANTQLLLSAAANVSKLLWPPRDAHSFCDDLLELLDIQRPSPLESRSLRNSFEHIGERVLEWAGSRLGEWYADSIIVRCEEELPERIPLRAFLEEDFAVVLLGQKHELEPIVGALEGVADRADPSAGTHL